MNTQNLLLVASLFAFGCGEKSDEERLDDLGAACTEMNDGYNILAANCGFPAMDFACDERISQTEENGCIDQAEDALACSERIGYSDLECDEADAALILCEDEGTAWAKCVGM